MTKDQLPEYDYTNTPAYRRKLRREKQKQEKTNKLLLQQGPITSILVSILDFFIDILVNIYELIMEFALYGFGSVYNIIYTNEGQLIPNSEKFGSSFSLKYFRYLITLFIPPLGVFLSKGLYGWFNVLLCFLFTYIHFLLGAIYAFVITHKNRYADRYENMEKKRLDLIKEYVKSCMGKDEDMHNSNNLSSLIYTILFFIALFSIIFYGLKYM